MTTATDESYLGVVQQTIETLRKQKGWSRSKLAQQAGLRGSTVHSLFAPGRQHFVVTDATLAALAEALGVPVDDLRAGDDYRAKRLLRAFRRLDSSRQEEVLANVTALAER